MAIGAYQATQVLVVIFIVRTAGKIRSRLADPNISGVQAHTFHAVTLHQLVCFRLTAIGERRPNIQAHKVPLVGTATRRLGLPTGRVTVRDLAVEVE